jgi:DNA-binding response OmpR family regulator
MAQILIADDEIYVRDLIKRSLAHGPHSFFEASDGNETIRILEAYPVDLLIIDMVMPHKGGLETLMDLRLKNENLKVIAITGKISTDRDSMKGLARQFHIDAVFEKPFDIFEFTQSVESLLEK